MRIVISFIVLMVVLFSCSNGNLLPLSGDYEPGTLIFELEDSKRLESYDLNSMENRVIQVRAWYPGERGQVGDYPVYSTKGVAREFQKLYKIPSFLVAGGHGRAKINIKPARGEFPVLIFNHGWTSWESQNASSMEQLASNGYIVLSINRPYESLFTEFLSGKKVSFSVPQYVSQMKELNKDPDGIGRELAAIYNPILASRTKDEYIKNMVKLGRSDLYLHVIPSVKNSVLDSSFLINSLKDLDLGLVDTLLKGHLQEDNVGVFGHSFGGVVSGEISMLGFSQVKAGISYDSPQIFTDVNRDLSFKNPYLFMSSTEVVYGKEKIDLSGINDMYAKFTNKEITSGSIKGTAHFNFSDMSYISFLKNTPMLGSLNGVRAIEIVDNMTLDYFNYYLKGEEKPYEKWEMEYPEWFFTNRQ